MSEDLETVYYTPNVLEAEFLKMTLEGEGIRCLLENENQAGLAGVLEIKLDVASADADRAKEIIEEVRHTIQHEGSEDDSDEEE
ncbi:DUF2007 domain-containing protein [Gimesia aquarii]|uniref:DUF2007 domain-containing protein n=1 Tax=Gimesia aquarii TaxID=2527964 RepID=A0A517WY57_9PLAN|nr:DUF2007 domain-containing protein [Gimesia aquarii]QDT96621.1 hypothetical protein V144x_20790 [Gimesia aquarii]QDU10195.1 hypothetical protein V202x_35940 [Gimesia aquarii]